MAAKEEMKTDLINKIEQARQALNESIDEGQKYELIYENSVKLDSLIERYIVAEY